jgi:hypothetical protein
MSGAGNVKGNSKDEETGFRQLLLSDFGTNRQKYYLLEGFGEASLPPLETRTLIINSTNKDISYCIGALNNLDFDSLGHGDKMIFSTSEDGTEIQSQIKLLNTGKMEIITKSDIDITTDAKINIIATQFNVNNGNLTVE